jgi:hypothetical protein
MKKGEEFAASRFGKHFSLQIALPMLLTDRSPYSLHVSELDAYMQRLTKYGRLSHCTNPLSRAYLQLLTLARTTST